MLTSLHLFCFSRVPADVYRPKPGAVPGNASGPFGSDLCECISYPALLTPHHCTPHQPILSSPVTRKKGSLTCTFQWHYQHENLQSIHFLEIGHEKICPALLLHKRTSIHICWHDFWYKIIFKKTITHFMNEIFSSIRHYWMLNARCRSEDDLTWGKKSVVVSINSQGVNRFTQEILSLPKFGNN